ncbi:hypothetical protein MTQ01_22395 [Streptomyces sp. XM4193]|uniref:hypothetical protein n=1 Tax=Streptomyces sp. XM4193 TaxID=2929782 RepID=UPI001FF91C02|nr:hypothetical protein [Streptomyces sp. XM4193]MCK1798725.1 hypothetical protein [Streptomyces sp. XM4193]
MPLSSEEPQIHPSVPGPRQPAAPARTSQPTGVSGSAGPRPGPRPAPPRADRSRPGPSRPTTGARPAVGTAQTSERPGDLAAGPASGPRPGAGTATAVRPDGAEAASTAKIELVDTTDAGAIDTADETVDRLLDLGRAPSDVLLLTTGDQHPWAQHELSFGADAYWRQQSEGDDVFAAHASHAAQAAARPVVILAVNGGSDAEVAGALPQALGRATDELIVCGDPARLRTLL